MTRRERLMRKVAEALRGEDTVAAVDACFAAAVFIGDRAGWDAREFVTRANLAWIDYATPKMDPLTENSRGFISRATPAEKAMARQSQIHLAAVGGLGPLPLEPADLERIDTSDWVCRVCGCSDLKACYAPRIGVPCSWVGHKLCSYCSALGARHVPRKERAK